MKTYFFIFFVILINLSLISAQLNLDKGSMVFELDNGKKICNVIRITSEDYIGKLKIRDIWPQIGEEESSFHKYTFTAEDYGLHITHPLEISNFKGNEEIEVCLSGGNKSGNFKGALIFTPEAGDEQVSVVVEIGTWLLVNVKNPVKSITPPATTEESSINKGPTASEGILQEPNEENKINNNIQQEDAENKTILEDETQTSWITGAAIGALKNNSTIIIIFLLIIIIGVLTIQNHRMKKGA